MPSLRVIQPLDINSANTPSDVTRTSLALSVTLLSKIIIKYNIQPIFNLYITIVMYLTYNINEKKSIINKNL